MEVTIIGDLISDLTFYLNTFPEEGADAKAKEFTEFPGGAAANVAIGLSRLGVTTNFFSAVGNDSRGEWLVHLLKQDGVRAHVTRRQGPTGVCLALVSRNSRTFITQADVQFELSPEDISSISGEMLYFVGYVLNGDSRISVEKAIKIAKNRGMKIAFDPSLYAAQNYKIKSFVKSSDILFVNKVEDKLIDEEVPTRVIKMGDKGCEVLTPEGRIRVSGFKIKPLDTIGTGDSFDAAFMYGLLNKWPLKNTARFANAAGAITALVNGGRPGFNNLKDIEGFIQKHK